MDTAKDPETPETKPEQGADTTSSPGNATDTAAEGAGNGESSFETAGDGTDTTKLVTIAEDHQDRGDDAAADAVLSDVPLTTEPVFRGGLLRQTKLTPEERIQRGLVPQVQYLVDGAPVDTIEQAKAVALDIGNRMGALGQAFERLAANEADEARAARLKRLAQGLAMAPAGIAGELEDL
jgi:hypothetical protein